MSTPDDGACAYQRLNRASMMPTPSSPMGGSYQPASAFRRHTYGYPADLPSCLIPGLCPDPLQVRGQEPRMMQTRSAMTTSVPTSAAQRRPEPGPVHHIRPRPARREPKPEDLFLPTAAPLPPAPPAHGIRPRPQPRPRPADLYVCHATGTSRPPPSAGLTVVMERRRTHQLPDSTTKAKVECINYKGKNLLKRTRNFMYRQCQTLVSH